MNTNLGRLSEAELAEWQYDHRDELDAHLGEPVDVTMADDLAVTISFETSGAEADAIRRAAAAAGVSMSTWIRAAILAGLHDVNPSEGSSPGDDQEEG